MPSSKASSWPRDQIDISCIFCIAGWILYPLSHQGSPLIRLLTIITRLFLHCRAGETEAQIYLKSPHKDSNLEWKPLLRDENLQRATGTWTVFKTKTCMTCPLHFLVALVMIKHHPQTCLAPLTLTLPSLIHGLGAGSLLGDFSWIEKLSDTPQGKRKTTEQLLNFKTRSRLCGKLGQVVGVDGASVSLQV